MKKIFFLIIGVCIITLYGCLSCNKASKVSSIDPTQTTFDTIEGRDFTFIETGRTAYDTITRHYAPIYISESPLEEFVNDSLWFPVFKQLHDTIIDNFSKYPSGIMSMNTFFLEENHAVIYLDKASHEQSIPYEAFKVPELVNRSRIGDKDAWKELEKIVWNHCKMTNEIIDNRIEVLSYNYPDSVLLSFSFPKSQIPLYIVSHIRNFKYYIPFSDNLLETYLRRISDGNLSLLNIENDSLAAEFLKAKFIQNKKAIATELGKNWEKS